MYVIHCGSHILYFNTITFDLERLKSFVYNFKVNKVTVVVTHRIDTKL